MSKCKLRKKNVFFPTYIGSEQKRVSHTRDSLIAVRQCSPHTHTHTYTHTHACFGVPLQRTAQLTYTSLSISPPLASCLSLFLLHPSALSNSLCVSCLFVSFSVPFLFLIFHGVALSCKPTYSPPPPLSSLFPNLSRTLLFSPLSIPIPQRA